MNLPFELWHSAEPVLVQEKLHELIERLNQQGLAYERKTLERGAPWVQLLSQLRQQPLFGPAPILLARSLDMPLEKDIAPLSEALKQLNPKPGLVLVLPLLDKKQLAVAWFKALENTGIKVSALNPPSQANMAKELMRRAAASGHKLQGQAAQVLAADSEGHFSAALMALEQLQLLHPEGEWTLEVIEQMRTPAMVFSPWQIDEPLLQGDSERFLNMMHTMERDGESVVPVIHRLASVLLAAAQVEHGADAFHTCRSYALWGDRVRQVTHLAHKAGSVLLSQWLSRAHELDRQAKGLSAGDSWLGAMHLGNAVAQSMRKR